MKIGFIITDVTLSGGMERVTSLLANAFIKRGYDIEILSLTKEKHKLTYEFDPAITITYLTEGAYGRSQSFGKRILMQLRMVWNLKKHLNNSRCNIYIAQGFLPAAFAYFLGVGNHTIACEHFKYEMYTNHHVLKIRNKIYRSLFKVVTLTDKDADKFKKHSVDAMVIPNMVTFDISPEIGFGVRSSRKILSVGRLEKQKGYDLLIQAVNKVCDGLNDWNIDIYGIGGVRINYLLN